MAEIPMFPPMCVQLAEKTLCDAFGIEVTCIPSFPQEDYFKVTATHGHLLVVCLLVCIGLLNLSFVDWSNRGDHFMKIQTSLYALITASFAFARLYWGVSQLLMIGAAMHNLFEWFFFIQVSAWVDSPQAFWRIVYKAIFFITAIMVGVVLSPTLMMSIAVEQSFGIMMDFGLLLAYASGFLANIKNSGKDTIDTGDAGERKHGVSIRQHQLGLENFYAVPLLAHGIHLAFTILPLVFVNFHALTVTWYSSYMLEGAVYISAPITHLLYMHWSVVFDRTRSDNTIKDNPKAQKVLPEKLRVKRPFLILVISFFMGLIPLFVIPKMVMGDCPHETVCPDSPVIVGTAVGTVHDGFGPAWETWVAKNDLVAKARVQPGNLFYEMTVNRNNPNEYRFNEHWESMEALQAWLGGGVTRKMFSDKTTMNMLVGGRLHVEGYQPVKPARCLHLNTVKKGETVDGALYMHTGATCDKVWETMGDWNTCSWVIGCDYTVVSEEDKTVRTLIFDGGKHKIKEVLRAISDENKTFTYEVLESTSKPMVGFTANVRLTEADEGCDFHYKFKTTAKDKLEAIYSDYINNRIPALQKMYAK